MRADLEFQTIDACINFCGEQGAKGEKGDTPDLSNYDHNPINIQSHSYWDADSEQFVQGKITLKSDADEVPAEEYAELVLDGTQAKLTSAHHNSPNTSSLQISDGCVKATALDWPSYSNAEATLTNLSFTVKAFTENEGGEPIENHYNFKEGFATESNDGTNYRTLNYISGNTAPKTQVEDSEPEAAWPVGIHYQDTRNNDYYTLVNKTVEQIPGTGTFIDLNWQKNPAFSLLWENSDPTAVFAGQDVDLSDSLANYRWIMIESGTVANSMTIVQHSGIFRTDFTMIAGGISSINNSSTQVQIMTRNIQKSSDTKLHIYDGIMNSVVMATGVWTNASNSGVLKPLRIFGIK